jgi:hypothetical protein
MVDDLAIIHVTATCSEWSLFIQGCAKSSKIPRRHLQRVDLKVGDIDVARPDGRKLGFAAIETASAMFGFIAASGRQYKGFVFTADAIEHLRLVDEIFGDYVDDAANALHLSPAGHHLGAENDLALLVE